jgi:hypothetical protein
MPPKKKIIEKPKEPIVVVTDKETHYRFNWIMVRRKINAFTQLFKFKRKPKVIAAPPPPHDERILPPLPEEKPKRVRKPRVKKEVKEA